MKKTVILVFISAFIALSGAASDLGRSEKVVRQEQIAWANSNGVRVAMDRPDYLLLSSPGSEQEFFFHEGVLVGYVRRLDPAVNERQLQQALSVYRGYSTTMRNNRQSKCTSIYSRNGYGVFAEFPEDSLRPFNSREFHVVCAEEKEGSMILVRVLKWVGCTSAENPALKAMEHTLGLYLPMNGSTVVIP